MIDPQSGLTLFNAIATAGKTIFDIAQGTSKIEEKQELMSAYDLLMGLKRQVAELEDENHELKKKLRFRSGDFEFKNPFWFEKAFPERALCPKCFSKQIIAPVGKQYDNGVAIWRKCLTCESAIEEAPSRKGHGEPYGYGGGGPNDWMR
jgi:hypothetical protein